MIERVRRFAMSRFATAMPGLAATLYERAMLAPARPIHPPRVNHHAGEPEVQRLPYGDGWIVARVWGSGPAVLLVHGWSRSAADMDAFVEPLVHRGFRAIAFDAPAHGDSDGRRTNLVQCAGAALQVGAVFGPVWGVIAHSFGCPTAALAASSGLRFGRLVLIGPPCSMPEMVAMRGEQAGVPRHVIDLANQRIAARLRIDWNAIATDRLVAELEVPVLVIHDRGDRTVPFAHGATIAAAARSGRLVATTGLGHDAVLWDPGVVREAAEFMRSDVGA